MIFFSSEEEIEPQKEKFQFPSLGKKIINKLDSKEKIDKTTIKMYFDLFKIKNPSIS